MGIGASIFLIALGAIITFGVNADGHVGWLNVDRVGWILMAVGLVGLLLTLYFWQTRRRRAVQPPVLDDDRGLYPDDRGPYREEYHERTELHPEDRRQ
jgi:uncharacterized protein DUF6458